MWKYLEGCKPPAEKKSKTEEEKKEVSQKYESEKRHRTFQKNWTSEFDWLIFDQNNSLMYCRICRACYSDLSISKLPDKGLFRKYSKGPFVVGSTNLKHSSLKDHDKSQGHVTAETHVKNRAKPGESQAEKSLVQLNTAVFDKLTILFRNAIPLPRITGHSLITFGSIS